jgi:putative ABC transport system permease protein
MNISESIRLAFDSVRVNKLRAFLTLLSISIGVFAIIGAGTLTSSLEGVVTTELENIGETTFWIEKMPKIVTDATWHKLQKRKPITYAQVQDLKRDMTLTDMISVSGVSGGATLKYGNESTNPDIFIIGSDENFFSILSLNVDQGRPIVKQDIDFNRNVCVIGNDVVVKLFPNDNPIDKIISIKNQNFQVVGVLETQGAVLGQSKDNRVVIPITNFLQYYVEEWRESLTISVKAQDMKSLPATIDEAIGIMRVIRKDLPGDDNSFELSTNETITEQFGGFVNFLSAIGWISGGFALIAAGVGIMNIMLVSVKERTREIGIRKAVGARKSWIMTQFIVEAITLCQIGCLVGILFGIGGAGVLSMLISVKIVFPVAWVIASIIICTLMGVSFGAYPAWKAANLDPIDALRYE